MVPQATPTPEPSPTPANTSADEEQATRLRSLGWATNMQKRTVPLGEVGFWGLLRDQIPPIYTPRFDTPEQANAYLEADEPVIGLEIKGDARAYPLRILIYHEIVNDEVGGEPVAVTY